MRTLKAVVSTMKVLRLSERSILVDNRRTSCATVVMQHYFHHRTKANNFPKIAFSCIFDWNCFVNPKIREKNPMGEPGFFVI